jgi:hypothetical protein
VLILTEGQPRYWGPIDQVHREFSARTDSNTLSLEEIFFRATELIPESDQFA